MTKLLSFKQKQNEATLSKLNLKSSSGLNKPEKMVKFVIFSFTNQCKAVAPLGPILGQFNVNLIQFCELFNKNTKNYIDGFYLTGSVQKKLKAKEFILKLNSPNLKLLLESLVAHYLQTDEIEQIEQLFPNLPLELIYDLVLLNSFFNKISVFKSAKLVLAYFKSNLIIKQLQIN